MLNLIHNITSAIRLYLALTYLPQATPIRLIWVHGDYWVVRVGSVNEPEFSGHHLYKQIECAITYYKLKKVI